MQRGDSGWPLDNAMKYIQEAGEGVIVLLGQVEDKDELLQHVTQYHEEDEGETKVERESSPDLRTYGIGAQILLDLDVRKMRVLSSPIRLHSLSGFGLEVVEYVEHD
jgi:3,4-dihydroxy 2-butanone 4-phosphate synthase/GTP cyclohydrolase II